jgi:hypothetical protein
MQNDRKVLYACVFGRIRAERLAHEHVIAPAKAVSVIQP